MAVRTETIEGVTRVTCDGPLTVPDGKAEFLQSLDGASSAGEMRFVLDLREVPYMDSPTIGAMMSCFKQAIGRGGAVKLVLGEAGKVREILELTGLTGVVEIFDEPEAAASSFGGGA